MTNLEEISDRFFKNGNILLVSRLNQSGLPISFVSPNINELLGYVSDELIAENKSYIDLISIDDLIEFQDRLLELSSKQIQFLEIEYRLKQKNGDELLVKDTITPEFDDSENIIAFHSRIESITDNQDTINELSQQALIDTLTQIPNRKNLEEIVNKHIINSKRNKSYSCLIIVNIDRFKFINNQYSFETGDKLLELVANRLKKVVRKEDYLARISADEFVCIISGLNQDKEAALKNAKKIATKIRDIIGAPYNIDEMVIKISSSSGICLLPEQDFKAQKILNFADIALTHSKSSGQNNIQSFDEQMRKKNKHWLNLEKDLIYALNNKELDLHFQPIVNKDRNIIAFESLLRWEHLTKGNIPPTEFIPIAESTGLLQQLGEYVIEKACEQLSIWQQENVICDDRIQYLSVNVSPNQFWHTNFETHLKENILSKKIDPKHLLIEITENIFVGDIETAIDKINDIKKLGVKIALDDFGSGYSSLSYLMKLPIDIVKLDRAFIQDVHLDDVKATIIKSVCEIAKKLKLKVIAEGLETTEELQVLVRYDCDAYQGFYFFRPANLVNLKKILQIKPQIGFNDFNNTVELPTDKQNAHVFNI